MLFRHETRSNPIILSTGSLYNYEASRVFALAAETGYDGVEALIDGRLETRDPVYLRGLCHEYGLPIVAMHSPFVSEVQGWPSDQLGRLVYTVGLAQELGVPLVVAHLPLRFYPVSYLHPLGYCRFLRRILCPRLEAYFCYVREGRVHEMETSSGVVIAFENMPARRLLGRTINPYWFNHPDQLVRLPHITLDTTHLGTWKFNPVEEYERLKGHVVHVHLSNFDGREHRSPLDGHLPLAILLRHLAQDGYQGAVCVESTPDALEDADERKCRAALRRSLSFCKDHFTVAKGHPRSKQRR